MKTRSPIKIVGFMEPVGTSFQSAIADLNDVAMIIAAIIEGAQSRRKDKNLSFIF